MYLVYRAGQLYPMPIFTMAIGAYSSGYVVRDLGWPFGLALILAVGLGAFFSFLPALRLGRVPAFTTAIAGIALIFIGQTIIRNLWFLGGVHGLYHIPKVEYLLPVAYVALLIVGLFIYRLDHSRLGRATEVIFINPDAAASLGIDTYKVRVFLQTVAGALGALAGVFYAFSMRNIEVGDFSFSLLIYAFCFLFIGGATTMWGTIVFTPILWAVTIFLPGFICIWKDIIYGSLLMVVIILRPEGVIDKEAIRAISIKSRRWLERLTTRHKLEVLK